MYKCLTSKSLLHEEAMMTGLLPKRARSVVFDKGISLRRIMNRVEPMQFFVGPLPARMGLVLKISLLCLTWKDLL